MPSTVKRTIRAAYVSFGAATASLRAEPDFLLIGGQRCGTTSLFRALEQHPQIVRPTLNKGINYFDLNYSKGPRWYSGHFPTRRAARQRSGEGRQPLTFEASGYYLFHPLACARIARDLPDVKIVVMLREPVERAYSAWKHEKARGFETQSFSDALALEAQRTAGAVERITANPQYQSFSHRHHSYAARSDYVSQLRPYFDRFPAEQIHVVYSENFFASPVAEFRSLTHFLGADDVAGISLDQHNARPGRPMSSDAARQLRMRFAGESDRLAHLVGSPPPWP